MRVAKLPWVEDVVRCNGKLNMVHCKVYNEIDGREKLLIFKFDNLQKHVGRQKCNIACHRFDVG